MKTLKSFLTNESVNDRSSRRNINEANSLVTYEITLFGSIPFKGDEDEMDDFMESDFPTSELYVAIGADADEEASIDWEIERGNFIAFSVEANKAQMEIKGFDKGPREQDKILRNQIKKAMEKFEKDHKDMNIKLRIEMLDIDSVENL